VGGGSSGSCLLAQASRSAVQELLVIWGKQACWPASSVTVFPWYFRMKVAGHVVRGSMESRVSVCTEKQDLLLSEC
jgi:hypothetical protein